jgi:hypothetical protein
MARPCGHCQEVGHGRAECPKKKAGTKPIPLKARPCGYCKQPDGHTPKCPRGKRTAATNGDPPTGRGVNGRGRAGRTTGAGAPRQSSPAPDRPGPLTAAGLLAQVEEELAPLKVRVATLEAARGVLVEKLAG